LAKRSSAIPSEARLAQANDTDAWIRLPKEPRSSVPYNLRYIATQADTIVTITQKFHRRKGQRRGCSSVQPHEGATGRRGDVILVPLTNLPLTEAGKAEAAASTPRCQPGGGPRRESAARKVGSEMPVLLGDIRAAATSTPSPEVGGCRARRPDQAAARPHPRQLTEAYARARSGRARGRIVRRLARERPKVRLDPVMLSPKDHAACSRAQP